MKLLFLGASAALSVGKNLFQANILLESDSGRKMLIDCGTDARLSLYNQGYTHRDIDSVYISHLHSDHTGGLEWLGFAKCFIDNQKASLYISSDQVNTLWEKVLSGGMSSLENEQATLSTYFDVQPVTNNSFTWEHYVFRLIKTIHSLSNGEILPCYGLLITNATHKIFISTDTRFTSSLQPVYKEADIIFHDCETSPKASSQHARYEQLTTLDEATRKKMWLYDYNEGPLPDAKKDGFLGFVVTGQSFIF